MSIASTSAPTPSPTFHRRPRLRAVPDAVAHRHLPAPAGARDLPLVVRPDLVPTLSGDLVDYANLDHAASTPAFERVARAVESATRTYSSVHRGTGWLSRVTSAHYEAARDEVARFVGAREDDVVVFTRSTTDSVNLLARALPRDTSVVVFASEHHATLLPWRGRDTVRLPVPGSTRDAEALLEAALRALPGGTTRRPRQALVVLTAASNVTGEFWPVERLTAIARRHGARVLLDAAQYAAHQVIDLGALDVDWVAFSGHKVHAPYGTGVLAGRSDWLDAAQPYLAGGGATVQVTERGTRWATGAARHEAGSPNVLGAIALAAACATIREHRAAIEDHEARLTERLVDGLRDLDGVTTYSIFGDDTARGPGRHLHRRRPRQPPRGGGPVGRARHRGAGREVLRAPAGRHPARRGLRRARHRGAGQRRAGQHAGARRPAARRGGDAGHRRPRRGLRAHCRAGLGARRRHPRAGHAAALVT